MKPALPSCAPKPNARDGNISDEILESIAKQIQSNIRELEGALNRIIAFADLSGSSLTPDLVEVALADLLPQRRNIQPSRVIEAVASAYEGIGVADLVGQNRAAKVAILVNWLCIF